MRRHLSLIFAGLIALSIPAWVQGQDAASPDGPAAAQAERERQLEAARQKWESLSAEEKQRLLERWRQYQQLPDETRQQALDNYNRLKAAESGATSAPDPHATPQNPPATAESPADLAQRLRRFSADEVYRERLRQLHDELGRMLRRDPALVERLRRMPPEEQREFLMQARERIFNQATYAFLVEIGVDEASAEQVMAVLDEHRHAEDAAFREYHDAMRDHERQVVEQIRTVAGDRAAQMALRFSRHGNPIDSMRGPRDGNPNWRRDHDREQPMGPPMPPNQMVPPWERWDRAAREARFGGPAIRQLRESFDGLMRRLDEHRDGPPPHPRELIFSVLRAVEGSTTPEQRREFSRHLFAPPHGPEDRPDGPPNDRPRGPNGPGPNGGPNDRPNEFDRRR